MPRAPSLPKPGEQTPDERRKISKRFIIHARKELKSGNRLQAGEKAWGAASQYLKIIGEQRGWPHERHSSLEDIGRQIIAENEGRAGIALLSDALSDAYHVGHRNFYENQMEKATLERAITVMEEALPVLEDISVSPWPPVTIGSNTERKRLVRLTNIKDLKVGDYSPHGFSLKPPPNRPVRNIQPRAGKSPNPVENGTRGKGNRRRRKPTNGADKPRTVNVTLT